MGIKGILKEYHKGLIAGLISGLIVAMLMMIVNAGCKWNTPECYSVYGKFFLFYLVLYLIGFTAIIFLEKLFFHMKEDKKRDKMDTDKDNKQNHRKG